MFVTLSIQHSVCTHHIVTCGLPGNVHTPYCHLWPARQCSVFHIILETARFSEKLKIKYVFWFSLQILSATCLNLRIIKGDMIKMYIGLHVECTLFLSNFSGTKIFSTNVRTNIQYKIPLKSVQWEPSCSMKTDGRTDGRTDRQVDRQTENVRKLIVKNTFYKCS
jgi:hypothetical protein